MYRMTSRNAGVLVCGGPCAADGYGCGVESREYKIASPAAPELSLCEKAEKDGWRYDLGFFAMALGHTTLCPNCPRKP